MSTTIDDRPIAILLAYLATHGSIRHADASLAFSQLAEHVDGLTAEELPAAADRAKAISRELRSLAWRVQTAAENERRRNTPHR
jgi:hypothetical protein